ncbi:MAG: hypothetical protein A3F41_06155 [Coxiella sp. RIFCSPHIGHO2_12_FULL_44_14]|nr:MAG: hypothetical protein A3F41_06155 [Coxiella sp. RIFCSPHIGHO2_12_FULL_44_14]
MLLQRLIPTLLLKNKRLVKGKQYRDFRDAGNPKTTARAHNHQGADELLVLDIEASRYGRAPDVDTVRALAEECFMPLCVGGGISDLSIAEACMQAGADKLCLTTTALDDPQLISRLARRLGSQAVVVGIDVGYDAHREVRLFDHRIASFIPNRHPWEWMAHAVALGAGEIRLMVVDREGTGVGYDLALYQQAKKWVNVPIILEGGAGTLLHLQAAFEAGVEGVAVGSMLVFSDANLVKIKKHMLTHRCRLRE